MEDPKTTEKPEDFDLGMRSYNLLLQEPYFCEISRFIKKVPTKSIPTAGVKFNPETLTFEMLYNPVFFSSLPKNEQVGVIKHEFYHISLGHCTSRSVKTTSHKVQNIAMDLAINSLPGMPENLPQFCCFPGRGEFKDLPPGQAFDFYLDKVDQLVKENEKNKKGKKGEKGDSKPGSGGGDGGEYGQFDSHDGWGEDISADDADSASAEGAIKQVAEEKLKDIIQKAADAAMRDRSHGWGSVPLEAQKLILARLSQKPNPKAVLGYFIKTSVRADRIHRVTKINRRYPYIHPGRAWNRRAKIAISIDQSGSVGDEMLSKFFTWLNDFAQYADFTVVPFDDQVFEDKVYVWKKGTKHAKERVLCGGTNFDAPTSYVNENDFDGHIICTDMCAPAPKRSLCQRMWVTDSACAASPYFSTKERVLIVE